jgi:hypothetical protein
MTMVIGEVALEADRLKSGLSLLFAPGARPDVDEIARALESLDATAPGAIISHRPDPAEGWIELLVNGLTFELFGLDPAAAMPVSPARHRFGLDPSITSAPLEAVTLVAGSHIYGGRALEPIVRAITGLGASLALALPVAAVCWEPGGGWMEPRYFTRVIVGWLAGGPFPALGLTALETDEAGVVRSHGLDFFCNQEIEVLPRPGEASSDTAKLALRVIDNLVRRGRIERRTELESPSDRAIIAEPSADLSRVRVWRGG